MKRLVNRLSGACLYVLLALIVGMSSCEDDANDWTVNKNYDALFRPLTFDKSATDATSVTLMLRYRVPQAMVRSDEAAAACRTVGR